MSDTTGRLNLPFLMANQAQKHVTLNESLRRLDMLVQATVLSATLGLEPEAPGEGDQYILPDGAAGGAWSGLQAGSLVAWQDGAWAALTPATGWLVHIADEADTARYDGSAWIRSASAGTFETLGVNASGDTTNRLAVKSDAELLSHDDVTPGTGDARKIINKAATARTASLLLQSGWSGRAEIGLVGEDNLAVKVSADGAAFQDAARFDAATGEASFPQGVRHGPTGALTRSLIPVSGGDGASSIFRLNPVRPQNPRTTTLASVTGDTLTLTASEADFIFDEARMGGVSLIRIWNVSRTPIEPAWVKAAPAGDQLQVSEAAAVAAWSNGDTIQVGDPDEVTPGRVMAIDISPMMQALFGTVFAQAGLLLKLAALPGSTGESGLEVSPNGAGGTFVNVRGYAGEASPSSQLLIACDTPSPVSDANLVFIREAAITGDVGICLATVMGVLV